MRSVWGCVHFLTVWNERRNQYIVHRDSGVKSEPDRIRLSSPPSRGFTHSLSPETSDINRLMEKRRSGAEIFSDSLYGQRCSLIKSSVQYTFASLANPGINLGQHSAWLFRCRLAVQHRFQLLHILSRKTQRLQPGLKRVKIADCNMQCILLRKGMVVSTDHASVTDITVEIGEPAEFGKNRTLRFSGHP